MLSVTVNARGEIAEMRFHTEKYRMMAPAELAAAIIEVVERARRDVAQQVSTAMGTLVPGDSAAREQAVAGDPTALLEELGLGNVRSPK